MALPDDFSNPDIPRSQGEFWRMYVHNSEILNNKLDVIDKTYNEDREDFVQVVDSLKDILAKHSSCMDSLDYRLKAIECEKIPEKLDVVNETINAIRIKQNWFAGINATLTTFMGILITLLKH
jgi:predicted adenine nucleotide alpha hydrolase (AANH) superfamily ATPase